MPPNRWISVPGELTVQKFQDKVSLQAKLGGKYDLRRYFCDDGELFHLSGRTYALSNQWSANTISVIDEIIAKLPPGSVSFVKATETNRVSSRNEMLLVLSYVLPQLEAAF